MSLTKLINKYSNDLDIYIEMGGLEREDIDRDRCRITSIEYDETGIEIAEVILPPKELPKILPCSLADK